MLRTALLSLALCTLLAAPAGAKVIAVTTFFDDNDDSKCSLREAIRTASIDSPPYPGCNTGDGDDVVFLPAGTYTLASLGNDDDSGLTGDLDITGTDPLTIQGAGPTTVIDANGIDRAIDDRNSEPLLIADLTIRGGNPGLEGGAPASGGAIRATFGNLTLERVVLVGNRTADAPPSAGEPRVGGSGGALAAQTPLTIRDSVFRDNRTGAGGTTSLPNYYGGNGGSGGAIVVGGPSSPATIESSVFTGNSTGVGGNGSGGAGGNSSGSAIEASNTQLTIRNSRITGNTVGAQGTGFLAQVRGGAVNSANGAVVTLVYATIAGNVSDATDTPNGLGSRFQFGGTFNLRDSIVVGDGLVCAPGIADAGAVFTVAGSGCPGIAENVLLDADFVPGAGSAPVDAAGSPCPAFDVRGHSRPVGPACDAGAIERGPATLGISPDGLAFPDTLVGAMSPAQTLDVTYTGEGLAALGDLAVTGEFTASGCAGAVLANGESCTISAAFAPVVAGLRTGSLSLANPLAGAVGLSGTGIAPGSGGGGGGPGGGGSGGGPATARAAIEGASLKRKRRRVRLRVALTCPVTDACAERLQVRLKRKGRKITVERSVQIAAGAGSRQTFKLKRSFSERARKRAKVALRIRLLRDGLPAIERSLKTRVR